MKPSPVLTIGIVLTAVLSFALVLFSPSAAKAQTAPQGVAGAYAEQSDAEQITESFTTLILHADGTFMLVEASDRQQKTFVGTWQQGDALTVEGTVVGADSAWWSFWAHFAPREWSQALHNWLLLMLTGLTLTGIATSRGKPLEAMGPLALATGAFGLGYYFTDTGAVFEARSVHIGFGLLFSMGLMTLGAGLLVTGTRRSQRPQARATSEKSSSRHLGK